MRGAWLSLTVSALAGAGCFGQRDTLGLPCQLDDQCGSGEHCRDGVCGAMDAGTAEAAASTGSCEPKPLAVVRLASPVVLVVDHSAAAALAWDHDGDQRTPPLPRYGFAREILADVLPGEDDHVALGLATSPDGQGCAVDALAVTPTPSGTASVIDALPPDAGGPAPLGPALAQAYQALNGLPTAGVLLVTSGAPGCGGGDPEQLDTALADAVADAFADGIPTAVVGIDPPTGPTGVDIDGIPNGIVPSDAVAALGRAGGRAREPNGYFRATNVVALPALVRDAFFSVRTCAFKLSEAASPAALALHVDGQPLPARERCDGDGFAPIADDEVAICGSACDAIKLGAQLEAAQACP